MNNTNYQQSTGHIGFAFEGRMPVPIQDADRGEEARLMQYLQRLDLLTISTMKLKRVKGTRLSI